MFGFKTKVAIAFVASSVTAWIGIACNSSSSDEVTDGGETDTDNGSGAYRWHTSYGSPADMTIGTSLTLDGDQVYATGFSRASWTGANGESPLHDHTAANVWDAFIIKLND